MRHEILFVSFLFFFLLCNWFEVDLEKGKSCRSPMSVQVDARLTICAWPLNGYLLEMKVTRFECRSIGDSIGLPSRPFRSFPLSFPEHERSKRCRCVPYSSICPYAATSVSVERQDRPWTIKLPFRNSVRYGECRFLSCSQNLEEFSVLWRYTV